MSAAEESRLQPLITVCIPTFNRAKFLKDCVASVLQQDYPNMEVIVSDNASTDDTAEVMAAFPEVRYNRNPRNLGMMANWNTAVRMARGDLAIVVSDDDVMLPSALGTYALMMDDADVEFAYSPVEIVDGNGRSLGISPMSPGVESGHSFVYHTLSQRRVPYPSALIFRIPSARIIGNFPEIGNQSDVAFRIALAMRRPEAKVVSCSQPLVRYMMHSSAATVDPVLKLQGRAGFEEWVISTFPPSSREARLSLLGLLMMFRKLTGSDASTGEMQERLRKAIEQGIEMETQQFRKRVKGALSSKGRFAPLLLAELLPSYTVRWLNNRRFHQRPSFN